MKYRGTIFGVLCAIVCILLFNAVILFGAAGLVVLMFSLTVTFNWSVFWWLVLGVGISGALAVLFADLGD
jgi:hypothetical protein